VKRSAIKRKTALKTKTPIKRTAMVRKVKGDSWTLRKSRKVVAERSGGMCEARTPVCTGRYEHAHHILTRKRGGGDEPENLLATDHNCHEFIHAHPAVSLTKGWLRSSWDNNGM
jgi:hypothetical protein